MPAYRVNGEVYDIPNDKIESFEKRYPDATVEMYDNDGVVYDIPLSKRESFQKKFDKWSYTSTPDGNEDSGVTVVDGSLIEAMDGEDGSNVQPLPPSGTPPIVQGESLNGSNEPNSLTSTADADLSSAGERPLTDVDKALLSSRVNQIGRSADATVNDVNERIDAIRERRDNRTGLERWDDVVEGEKQYNASTGEFEPSYITPSGNRYAEKGLADIEMARMQKQAADVSVGGQLESARERLADLEERLALRGEVLREEHEVNKPGGIVGWLSNLGRVSNAYRTGGIENPEDFAEFDQDAEYQSLRLAVRKVKEEIQQLENAREKEESGERFWRDFGRNTLQSIADVDAWDFGKNKLRDARTMSDIAYKANNDIEMSDAEQDALYELYLHNGVMNEFGDLGRGARWGNIAGQSLSFMKDFLLTGGFAGVSTKLPAKFATKFATKQALKMGLDAAESIGVKVAKDGLMNTVRRGGKGIASKLLAEQGLLGTTKILGTKALGVNLEAALVRAPLMATTVQGQNLVADIIESKYGPVVVDKDTGELRFLNNKSWGEATWESSADRIIENYSEMWGAYLPGMADVAKTFGARKLTAMLLRSTRENAGTILSKTANFFSKAGLNGIVGEGLEEYNGQLWRTIFQLESAESNGVNNFLNSQWHGDVWGGMAMTIGLTGGVTMGANYVGNKIGDSAQYMMYKHAVNKADARASEVFTPAVWDEMRLIIEASDNDGIIDLANQVMTDDSMTEEQVGAVMDYMEKSLVLRGNNLREYVARRNGNDVSPEVNAINQGYTNGYRATGAQEMNDIKNMMDIQRQRVEGLVDEALLTDIDKAPQFSVDVVLNNKEMSEEQRDKVLDYIYARQVYNGMLQRVNDDIDTEVELSNAIVESRTNSATGLIQGATLKEGDRKVYIKSGSVVPFADGTGIDVEASDGSIVVRDELTGDEEMVSPDAIYSVEEAQDAAEVKEMSAQGIRERMQQQAWYKIYGAVTFNKGDSYTITGEDGSRVEITIVPNEDGVVDNGDGTVNVTDGEQIIPVDKSWIQEQVSAENMARVRDWEAQREAENEPLPPSGTPPIADAQGENGSNMSNSDVAPLPDYKVNDRITFTDGSGNLVYGAIEDIDENYRDPLQDRIVIGVIDPKTGYWGRSIEFSRSEIDNGLVVVTDRDGNLVYERAVEATDEVDGNEQIVEDDSSQLADNSRAYTENVQESGESVSYQLSDEVDENGRPFVLSTTGSTTFGEIREESGLTPAPIKLSEGFQDANGKGYGLAHIEANHGRQIRNAGFESVEDFVSFVAQNYDENNIRVGKRRNNAQTYLLQITDEYDNTLFVELSKDGSYWNVNSAGIFRKGYSNKKETVAKTEPQQPNNAVSTGSSLSNDGNIGTTSLDPNGEPTVSTDKDMSNVDEMQGDAQLSALSRIPNDAKGEPIYEQADTPDLAWDALVEVADGDVTMAQEVANDMVADKRKAVEKAKKLTPKAGSTPAEKMAARKEIRTIIEDAEGNLAIWERIAGVQSRRAMEADTEARRVAEVLAAQRRADEERLRAEREEAERMEREALQGVPDMVDDTAQDARARGYRRVNGHKVDRQGVLSPVRGRAVAVKFGNDVIPEGRVSVIDANELQPSHVGGVRNPLHFIDEAQPKERNDVASVASAERIAGDVRPEEITGSVTAYTGAPTVNSRGEVIQGNNRGDALRLMWEKYPEQAAKYKEYLKEHAEEFGLNAEEIDAMQSPVLVNMVDVDDAGAIALGQYVAQDTESGGVERIKPKNVVKRMGADMRSFANLLLKSGNEDSSFAELLDHNGREVLRWMNTKGYITPTQYQSAFDSKGNLSAEAKNDLRGIMYESIFQGGNTRLEEMFNALPAKAQKAILATAYRDYDSLSGERMIEEIQNSIRAYYALSLYGDFANAKNWKDARMAVEAWKRQAQFDDVTGESYLPAENFSNFALHLATMYKGESQSLIQGTFTQLYDLIQGSKQANLFEDSDNTLRTLGEAIKEVLNIDYNGEQRGNVLAGDSATSQAGEQGGEGTPAPRERVEGRDESTDGGRGVARGSGRGSTSREVGSNQSEEKQGEDVIGRSLSAEEAEILISEMETTAEVAPEIELTTDNWTALFGEDGRIDTPMGEVTMGQNQYFKLAQQGRDGKLGMVKPTLETPAIVIEDERATTTGKSERETAYLFIKTFTKKDGSRYYHFTSVTVSKDGKEVVISNQERSANRISKLLQQGKVAWIDTAFSLHPTAQIEESVPLNDSSKPTSSDNQSALLGINSSELSTDKGSENIETSNAESEKSAENGGDRALSLDGSAIGSDRGGSRPNGIQPAEVVGASSDGNGATGDRGAEIPSSSNGDVGIAPADGEQGDREVGLQGTETDGLSSRGGNTEGGRGNGQKRDSRISPRRRNSRKVARRVAFRDKDAGRERDEALTEINALLDEQGVTTPQLIPAGTKLGYAWVKEGVRELSDWRKEVVSDLSTPLSERAAFTDAQIDDFVLELWNSPISQDGKTLTVSQWAAQYGNETARHLVRTSIEERLRAQRDAESIPVRYDDIVNIAETLPMLLPAQQEDVLKAETQFFSPEHNDEEHAYGKGYLFTNGTGTGKTYTGLGIVKRMVKQGRKRVLIITPSDQKCKDWIEDGKNLLLDIRQLENTKDAGEGVVVTTYANFRQNRALFEGVFDLIVADESHRLMEGKNADYTEALRAMNRIANRTPDYALQRMLANDARYLELEESVYHAKDKADQAFKAQTNAEKRYGKYSTNHADAVRERQIADKELEDIRKELYAYRQAFEEANQESAQQAFENTKVVFLSATPFNDIDNLQYAEGYIFTYPKDKDGRGHMGTLKLRYFGAGYRKRYGRAEKHVENSEALARQERDFSDYLQNQLQTMSGRVLDSEYDYSRDFVLSSMENADMINAGLSALHEDDLSPLLPIAWQTFYDYNYSTALFETLKTATILPRLRQHLDAGRKIVIYHRRQSSGKPLSAPFKHMLDTARDALSGKVELKHPISEEDKPKLRSAIRNFEKRFAELLEFEQTLDYSMPREQLQKVFGNRVVFFSGKESEKVRSQSVAGFNDDYSDKDIIVVQEQSGKEGISLHDRSGVHPRVLIPLALPQSPITALQIEGRIYRVGNQSNAVFEYPLLGLDLETTLFGSQFNARVGTTENLALGSQARDLNRAFSQGVLEARADIPIESQGLGGKEADAAPIVTRDEFDNAVIDYYGTQKMKGKRDSREGVDFYPTPEPVGFKMVEWGGIEEGDKVLEPSAGSGSIARYVPKSNSLTAIEPSGDLFSRLQLRAGGGSNRKYVSDRFENHHIINKYDVIVMNPPFGTGGRMAIDHLSKAFDHLSEGGRVVALIPRGSTDKKFDKWYDGVENAVMVGEILLPSVTFERAGTSVSTRIVVIDKVSNEKMRSGMPSMERVDLSSASDPTELFEMIRDVEMPERTIDVNSIKTKVVESFKDDFLSIKGKRYGVYIEERNGELSVRVKNGQNHGNPWGYTHFELKLDELNYEGYKKALRWRDEAQQKVNDDASQNNEAELAAAETTVEMVAKAAKLSGTELSQAENDLRIEEEERKNYQNIIGTTQHIDGHDILIERRPRDGYNYAETSLRNVRVDNRFVGYARWSNTLGSMEFVDTSYQLIGTTFEDIIRYGEENVRYRLADSSENSEDEIGNIGEEELSLLQSNETRNAEVSERISQGERRAQNAKDESMERAERAIRRSQSGGANEVQLGGGESSLSRQEVEQRAAESYAKENGIWIPYDNVFDLGKMGPSGNEAETYVGNDGYIYKVNNLMNSKGILPLFERIKRHNQIFPESVYEFVGFTGFDGRSVYPIFRQQYVENATNATPKEIEGYMASLGFTPISNHEYTNGELTISDLRPRNVLKDAEGDLYVVDAEFKEESRERITPDDRTNKANKSNRANTQREISDAQYAKAKEIFDALHEAGFKDFKISRSITGFGVSTYIQGDLGLKIRLSDHSVTSTRRVLDEIHIDMDTPVDDVIEVAKRVGRRRDDRSEISDISKNREKRVADKWNRVSPRFDGMGFHVIDRTYQDLAEFIQKHPNASNVLQTSLDGGAYRYEWSEPKSVNSYGKDKPSRDYIEAYDDTTGNMMSVPEQMAERVNELATLLHLDNVEVVTNTDSLSAKDKGAKGFYTKRTGKITIVVPNHSSVADMEATFLHEAVAHYGLRQMFGKEFDTFLDHVFEHAEVGIRREITGLAAKHGWDIRKATEEYLAGLAERTNFEGAKESGWWQRIKDFFMEMLEKLGFSTYNGPVLTDNELRYILWRSYENLREGKYSGVMGIASDVAKQYELGVGEYANTLDVVNERFNEELDGLTEENADRVRLSCGLPSNMLINAGVPNKPLILYGNKLVKKAKQHGFNIRDVKSLPKAMQYPIAVFDGSHPNSYAVLTEMRLGDKNVLVSIETNKDGEIDFNLISSVFGKNGKGVIKWILDNKLRSVNKEKALRYISASAPIADATYREELDSATKIVESFENPRIEGENDVLYREGEEVDVSPRARYDKAVRTFTQNNRVRWNQNLLNRSRESYQDSMLALKVLQQIIAEESDKEILSYEDAYKAENRMSSENKAQAEIYERDFYRPLIQAIQDLIVKGAKYEEIKDYVIAKHGLERNIHMAQERAEEEFAKYKEEEPYGVRTLEDFVKAARKRDYSGLTALTKEKKVKDAEVEAQRMVEAFESKFPTDNLWEKINAATKETLRISYDSGMMSQETYEKVRNMYQHYVPLRGWNIDVASNEYEYVTSNHLTLSPALKAKAEGRESLADDPIATIGFMAESSIVQANRNLMKRKFLNMALNHQSSLLSVSKQWYVKKGENEWIPDNPVIPEDATGDEVAEIIRQHEAEMQELEKKGMAKTKRAGLKLDLNTTKREGMEHVVRVMRGGEEYCVYVNGNPRAAQAINGLTNPDISDNGLYKGAMVVKNWMARAFTSWNPAFVVANLSRDVIWSTTAVAVKEDPKYLGQYVKNIRGALGKFKLLNLLKKYKNGTLDNNIEIERLFGEFMRNGGETGFTQLSTVEDYKRNIKRFVKDAQGKTSKIRKGWNSAFDGIEFMNRAAEDTTRFMVYMTSRQMGRDIARSVWDAKEITVNFNKKGSGGLGASVMNFAFIFFNATIQSLANFGRLLYRHPKKMIGALALFGSTGLVVPFINMMFLGMLGDDDEKDAYWDLPEWVRRNNIVLWNPFSDRGFITIPLPHELRPFYGMGEIAASVILGKENVEEGITKAALGISAMMPFDVTAHGGWDSSRTKMDNMKRQILNFTPTIIQPVAQIIANTDYFGVPIYKNNDWNELDPEWAKAYKSTTPWLVDGTKWVNEVIGGGNNVDSGGFWDWNPAMIEHLFEAYTGGMGKTINKSFKTLQMLWDEDLREWENVPIASSFYKVPNEKNEGSQTNREYWDAVDEIKNTEHSFRGYQKQIGMGSDEYAEKLDNLMKSEAFKRYALVNGYNNAINEISSNLKYIDPSKREEGETAIMNLKVNMLESLDMLELLNKLKGAENADKIKAFEELTISERGNMRNVVFSFGGDERQELLKILDSFDERK